MKKYLIVTADQNDADFIMKKSPITDEEIEFIKPVIAALTQRKELFEKEKKWNLHHNWGTSEYTKESETPTALYITPGLLTKKQIDLFEEYIPYGEYGIHTILSIEVLIVQEEEVLFSYED